MTDNDTRETGDGSHDLETDGGAVTGAAQDHRDTDYLNQEVNLLKPSTPFMRDHLRVVWTGFVVWAIIVFGPVTLTWFAPDAMTTQMPVLGFPLHYFLVALGAPTGALILAFWYARKRDQLDEKYGIEHATAERADTDEAAAADGGVDR
jgi:putative solute:sodium symporter small subunit